MDADKNILKLIHQKLHKNMILYHPSSLDNLMLYLLMRFTISAEFAIVGLSPDERSVAVRIIEHLMDNPISTRKECDHNGYGEYIQCLTGDTPEH